MCVYRNPRLKGEPEMVDNRTVIAEAYLRMNRPGSGNTGMFVRLADKYGVPFGRIVNLTGLPADRIAAYIEGRE